MRRWAFLHFVVPSAIVLALGLLLLLGLDRQAHENQARINSAALDSDTQSVATVLESGVATYLSTVDALQAFMVVHPDTSVDDFNAYAAALLTNRPSINALYFTDAQTAPLYSYRAFHTRGSMPQRLLEGADVQAILDKTIRTGATSVYGPLDEPDGSLELFALAPVSRGGKMLGLAVAVYDVPNLLAVALPFSLSDSYVYTVIDRSGKVFFGALDLPGQTATREVQVGDGKWHIEVAWRRDPPATPAGTLSLIWGLGGVCVLAALGWINREQLALMRQSRLARENARLLAESNHLLQQTQALQVIITDVTARRTVEDVLNAVADQVAQVFGAQHVGIYVLGLEGEGSQWNITRNLDPAVNAAVVSVYHESGPVEIANSDKPITVEDVPAATQLGAVRDLLLEHGIYSLLVVPLRREGAVAGSLVLYHDSALRFSDQTCALAQTFANQATIALENANLLLQAHGKAALEERQRLARELHDSVSQALYGISLGARTGRTLLERDPVAAAEALDYVVSLAKAGLAEMRALIFELRPESLQNEGLVAALDKQAAALRARYNIEVGTRLGIEPDAPLAVKEAFYRIAQEALHNVIKHAHASQVNLSLDTRPDSVALLIRDDGRGFEADGEFPGHLGLNSMRERVGQLGGTLEVESAPGSGTLIRAQIPLLKPAPAPEPERVPAQV